MHVEFYYYVVNKSPIFTFLLAVVDNLLNNLLRENKDFTKSHLQ